MEKISRRSREALMGSGLVACVLHLWFLQMIWCRRLSSRRDLQLSMEQLAAKWEAVGMKIGTSKLETIVLSRMKLLLHGRNVWWDVFARRLYQIVYLVLMEAAAWTDLFRWITQHFTSTQAIVQQQCFRWLEARTPSPPHTHTHIHKKKKFLFTVLVQSKTVPPCFLKVETSGGHN